MLFARFYLPARVPSFAFCLLSPSLSFSFSLYLSIYLSIRPLTKPVARFLFFSRNVRSSCCAYATTVLSFLFCSRSSPRQSFTLLSGFAVFVFHPFLLLFGFPFGRVRSRSFVPSSFTIHVYNSPFRVRAQCELQMRASFSIVSSFFSIFTLSSLIDKQGVRWLIEILTNTANLFI